MTYIPCDDPKVKSKMAAENALLAMGGALNPITNLSHAHFAASTKQRFVTISIDAWSLPPGWFTHQLHVYGIPVDLKSLKYKCDSGIGIFLASTIIVPIRQAWMADRTLRALSCHQGFRVTSAPIYDKRRGSSKTSGDTGKIWKPWGAGTKTKSFGQGLSRGIAAAVGTGDAEMMKNLTALRELSDERRAEFEEARVDESGQKTGDTKRKPAGKPDRGHRHITVDPKKKTRRKRQRTRAAIQRGSHRNRDRGSHRGR